MPDKNDKLCEVLGVEKTSYKKLVCDCGRDVYHCVRCTEKQEITIREYPILKYRLNFGRAISFLCEKLDNLQIRHEDTYVLSTEHLGIIGVDKDKDEAMSEFMTNLVIYEFLGTKEVKKLFGY